MPAKSQAQRLTKPCHQCGRQYKVQCPARMDRSKFCSRACNALDVHGRNPEKMTVVRKPRGIKDQHAIRKCETCGEEYRPTGGKQRWCRVCCPGKTWLGRLQRYGVSKPMWDAMVQEQEGMCAICDAPPVFVDHCHATGKIRGLLCCSCNTKLAGLEVSEWRTRAEAYLVTRS